MLQGMRLPLPVSELERAKNLKGILLKQWALILFMRVPQPITRWANKRGLKTTNTYIPYTGITRRCKRLGRAPLAIKRYGLLQGIMQC